MQNISNQKIRTQKETLSCRPGGRSRNSSSNAFGASKTVEAREWWERNATSKAQSVRARVYNIFQTQAKISNTSTNAKIREHDKRKKKQSYQEQTGRKPRKRSASQQNQSFKLHSHQSINLAAVGPHHAISSRASRLTARNVCSRCCVKSKKCEP